MKEYRTKAELTAEIARTAALFLTEFTAVQEADKDLLLDGVDRTPAQMLAYQLGWMNLLQSWDRDELAGKEVVTPAPGLKWNQMGALYKQFYQDYSGHSLQELCGLYQEAVTAFIHWVDAFSEKALFQPEGRGWAASTASNWPVWKWIHINTVAPFGTFRSKIRKWKKLRAAV